MRTFVAIVCAAFAGLAIIGAASSIAAHDHGDAMVLGLLGGAALMGSLVAFRRPTEAERQAKQHRREARQAGARQPESAGTKDTIVGIAAVAIGILIMVGGSETARQWARQWFPAMTIQVHTPDGSSFSFPEGVSEELIKNAIDKHFGWQHAPSTQGVAAQAPAIPGKYFYDSKSFTQRPSW